MLKVEPLWPYNFIKVVIKHNYLVLSVPALFVIFSAKNDCIYIYVLFNYRTMQVLMLV